jgi:Flp pilus assembly protein TadG
VRLIHRIRAWRPTPPPALAGRHPGQMMVLFALSFVAILAGVGMSVDMGMWMVEKQHLQTAVDSAAVAGARYFVAYSGDANQLSLAQTQAQTFLTQYGYPASAFSGTGSSLTMTSPGTRQFRIQAVRRRPTMLVQFVGIRTLDATADTVANGEIKADIYVSLDLTGSMNSTDITNMKTAVNTFVDLLGLDATDPNGPKLGIGRFIGERCAHIPNGGYANFAAQRDATVAGNWVSFHNYTATTGSWCDNNDLMPTLAASTTAGGPPAPPTGWNNFYPGSITPVSGQLGQVAATAHSAVNGIDASVDSACVAPSWVAPPSLVPYGSCDVLSGTSHTAGLATAYQELYVSGHARSAPFRKVLILQTDGTACTMNTPYPQLTPAQSTVRTYLPTGILPVRNSSAIRSENKAMALANYMKTTPTAFEGTEIFTIMFWANDGSDTCFDQTVKDTENSRTPPAACGPDTAVLPAVGNRTHTDDYMIAMSSSLTNTCDHYIPADKNNPSSLTTAYRNILKRLAVGKLVS